MLTILSGDPSLQSELVQLGTEYPNTAIRHPAKAVAHRDIWYVLTTQGDIYVCSKANSRDLWPIRYEIRENFQSSEYKLAKWMLDTGMYPIIYQRVGESASDCEFKILCEQLDEAKLMWDTLVYIRSQYEVLSARP